MIRLEPSSSLSIRDRDFGVQVGGNHVRVPVSLYTSLSHMGVRSAEDLAAALVSFPAAFQSMTKLSPDQIELASQRLLRKLQMSFPHANMGSVGPKPKFKFGALAPEDLTASTDPLLKGVLQD